MANDVKLGEQVTLWTRPRTDLILVFGTGVYADNVMINGSYRPVITFDDKTEVTLMYPNVWCGAKASVDATIKKYSKEVTVVEWDLQRFLAGSLPDVDAVPQGPQQKGDPKTATDKLLAMRAEIEYNVKKIEVFKKNIADCEGIINTKRSEMLALKNNIMKELDAIEQMGIIPKEEQTETAVESTAVSNLPAEDEFRVAAERAAGDD